MLGSLVARGFTRSGQGNPDEARAARYILKDYVNAKLLFCHPPPGVSDDEFNEDTHQLALSRAAGKKRAPTTRVVKGADTFIDGHSAVIETRVYLNLWAERAVMISAHDESE